MDIHNEGIQTLKTQSIHCFVVKTAERSKQYSGLTWPVMTISSSCSGMELYSVTKTLVQKTTLADDKTSMYNNN